MGTDGADGVAEAAVVGVKDSLTGEAVHAFVVARDPSLQTVGLREHCRARLAPMKIPGRYTVVERLPRTATGKVRKDVLAAMAAHPSAEPMRRPTAAFAIPSAPAGARS
ncbi:MAG: hypothetical protein LBT74_02830 [Acidobacteriota bacterium]|nr:hypothetical protein [Acidobacteriota bacterium]